MSTSIQPSAIPEYIQSLLGDRQKHVDAIASIDGTLAAVSAALNGTIPARPKAVAAPAVIVAISAAAKGKKRGLRSQFAMSAEESVLAFVKAKKNPTSKEINLDFKAEGRSSTADNAMSKLVKEKKLKRTPLGKGIMGSRYSLM